MATKKLTPQKLKTLKMEELGKMKQEEMISVLEQARKLYEKRAATFEKKPSVYSYAYEKMEAYYEDGVQPTEQMSRNKAYTEIARLQSFFNSVTATVRGSQKVATDQDKRIFGENALGRPVHRMSKEERANFWHAYDEFKNQYKTAEAVFGSDKIQQFLGETKVAKKKDGFSMSDLEGLYEKLKRAAEDDNEYIPNVFSGRGSNF